MKFIIFIMISIFIVSCSSQHVTKPTNFLLAPKGYKPKGVIKYLNAGPASWVKKRREDAMKKMSEECSGKYKILKEADKPDNELITIGGTNTPLTIEANQWYVTYECEK